MSLVNNCIIDRNTNSIRTDINLSTFLYIEWNSEYTWGGGGLRHVRTCIRNLLRAYVYNELEVRPIIFSDDFRMEFRIHTDCFSLNKQTFSLADYYDFPYCIGSKNNIDIPLYFDFNGIFRDSFKTSECVGISSLEKGRGITKVRNNNNNILEVDESDIMKVIHLPYNFWIGKHFFHEHEKTYSHYHLLCHSLYFDTSSNIKQTADLIKNQILEQSKSFVRKFYVLHLRRPDKIDTDQPKLIENSGNLEFIAEQFSSQNCPIEEGSNIYIMSNGSENYIKQVKQLLEKRYYAYTKYDFSELMKDKYLIDNYCVFTAEEYLAKTSDGFIDNNVYGNPFTRQTPYYSLALAFDTNSIFQRVIY